MCVDPKTTDAINGGGWWYENCRQSADERFMKGFVFSSSSGVFFRSFKDLKNEEEEKKNSFALFQINHLTELMEQYICRLLSIY